MATTTSSDRVQSGFAPLLIVKSNLSFHQCRLNFMLDSLLSLKRYTNLFILTYSLVLIDCWIELNLQFILCSPHICTDEKKILTITQFPEQCLQLSNLTLPIRNHFKLNTYKLSSLLWQHLIFTFNLHGKLHFLAIPTPVP